MSTERDKPKRKRVTPLGDRQEWLLGWLLLRHPLGIAAVNHVAHGYHFKNKWVPAPIGIGMVNMRGLERRGFVHEPHTGLFYLTDTGLKESETIFGKENLR